MPTYKEFLQYVKGNILEYMPPAYRNYMVELVRNVKDNDLALEGITIRQGKKSVEMCPAVYLETYYTQFLSGRDIDHVMHGIAAEYLQALQVQERMTLPDLTDFGIAKSRIQYRVLNQRTNRERLRNAVYKPVEDLAKVYIITGNRLPGVEYAAVIRRDLLQCWGITEKELEQIAERNMDRSFQPVLLAGSDSERKLAPQELLQKNLLMQKRDVCREKIFILTNDNASCGASAMLMPGMPEKVRRIIGDDFYLLPIAMDEVLISPKKISPSPKKLGELVRAASRMLPREEVLSDCVYEFTRENPQIRRVPESMPQREKIRRDER